MSCLSVIVVGVGGEREGERSSGLLKVEKECSIEQVLQRRNL